MTRDLKKIIVESLQKAFRDYEEDYNHETYEQDGQTYIKERSARRCVEDFLDDLDAMDFIVDYLSQSTDFQEKIHKIASKVEF